MTKLITIPLSEHKQLLAKVSNLETQLEQLRLQHQTILSQYQGKYNQLLAENSVLQETVLSLKQQLFGKKKDKIKNSANIRDLNKAREEKLANKRGRKPIDPKYKADEVRKYDYASNPICDGCELEMHYVSSSCSHHEEHQIVFKKVKIEQAIYACRCCNKIIVARGCKPPIDKGLPLPGLLTQTVLDKFSSAMPMYRQAQNYSYMGINYSRQQISNWFSRAADLIEPLYNLIFQEVVSSNYIMADETPITLLNIENKDPGSKGHISVIKQGGKGIFNFVYCWAIDSRAGEVIEKKLAKFKGSLQVDGLNFYFKVLGQAGVIYVGCWSHVRRKFTDIIKLSGKLEGVAFEVVQKIDKLYNIEHRGAGLSKKGLLRLRKKEAVPIVKELKEYLTNIMKTTSPKGKLGVAIKYTLDRFDGLMQYTKNANLEIDNNATERCIKYVVMGRKNWLFADNINSANKLAMLYSLVVTCKTNNINPREYLEYIFTQLPYINRHNTNELRKLLPDKYDVNKRYDLEYRERAGIVETIIIRTTAEYIPKAA
ncbi:MAG: IS66 family transposase [Alphaproteobacteria bacterium]|nr:IS66 family transposase [Alphaproteobacteria bacterium]